jgi:hypothetical protein
MNVLTFETCWAVNSEIIKQATSSLYICFTCVKLEFLFYSTDFAIKISPSKKYHLYAVCVIRYLWISQFVCLFECQLETRHAIAIHRESLGWINYYSFDFLPCWTIRKSNFILQIKFQEKGHTDCQAMRFPSVYIRRMECSPRARNQHLYNKYLCIKTWWQLLTKLLHRL